MVSLVGLTAPACQTERRIPGVRFIAGSDSAEVRRLRQCCLGVGDRLLS